MKSLIAGNWKMNGDITALTHIMTVDDQLSSDVTETCDVVICPPATLLWAAVSAAAKKHVAIGAQDCHSSKSGAFTGDLSAEMVVEAGAEYIIVGHSERREYHSETNETVAAKADAAIDAGAVPIICVGESQTERESGKAVEIVTRQLHESLPNAAGQSKIVVAYEPIWAIGTGLVPSIEDITEMHDALRALLKQELRAHGESTQLLYGGSMKPDNAGEILKIANVDGGLVGGASLNADSFLAIISAL